MHNAHMEVQLEVQRFSAVPPLRRPTVALALGGGGARGLAHILMLEVLDELGLRPKVIAGTSIGAIFGAAYAAGMSAASIRAHSEEVLKQRFDFLRQVFAARQAPLRRLMSVLRLEQAFLNAESLLDLVLPRHLPETFAGLGIPLKIVAADFFRHEQVVLSSGPLRRAIAASIALPVFFAPVMSEGQALMDGGLVNPLPFDLVAGEADITIAIDVSGTAREPASMTPPSAFETLMAFPQILQHALVREKLRTRQPDIYIEVDVSPFQVHEFLKIKGILAAAEPAKAALRDKLLRILNAETVEPVKFSPDMETD